MDKKAVVVNRLFLIAGILCLLYYLGMGLAVRFGQSLLWLWPLMGAACLARWWFWRRAWDKGDAAPVPRGVILLVRVLAAIVVLLLVLVEGCVFSAAFRPAPDGLDALVILGARVNEDGPSGSLRERIGTAAAYLRRNPDTVAVASGGQGSDEPMSEAACIRGELIAAGIAPDRILLEDASTSTLENLSNSFALLEGRAETVGIVTNDFHVYRAVAVGRTLGGFTLSGVPARSSVFGFIHYALREFCAISVSWLRGGMAFT